MKLTIALDWDGTIVDKQGDWTPGAEQALRALLTRGHTVIVHSSRANWQGGIDQIAAKLGVLAQRVAIYPKPQADCYFDNRGHKFTDWSDVLTTVRIEARRKP